MAISEADLRRILTTEERNVLVMLSRARGADEQRLAARSLNMDVSRVQVIADRAQAKIARETRKGGRGVATAVEEVRCGCGQEFVPRRRGQLLCPACVELNGDGRPLDEPRSNGRSDHREPDHESDHESAQLDGPEASPDKAPDNGDVARNPPPARPFPADAEVEARRARIVRAVQDAGGECRRDAIKDAVGYGDPTLNNDLMRLTKMGALVKIPVSSRRALYRIPGERDVQVPEEDLATPSAPSQRRTRILDVIADAEDGCMSTMAISRRFPSVSYEAIRNDLDALHREGQLVKIRGAAIVEWRLVDGEDGEPPYFDTAKPQTGLTDAERAAAARAALIEEAEGDAAERGLADRKGQETLDVGDDAVPEPAIESAAEVATEKQPDEQPPTVIVHGPFVEPRAIDALRQRAADTAQQLMAEAERLAEAADMAVPETLLRARYIAALLSRVEAGDTSPDLLDRFERLAFGESA